MEALVLAILKAVASGLIKLYFSNLAGGQQQLVYREAELGYKVPKWYMAPGEPGDTFYAYGTSVQGNEFDSLEDAKQRALEQMANAFRLSNRKIVEDLRYDRDNLKQKRLVELFVRNEGLEDFVRAQAKIDRQQLVEVKKPERDIRAFVRLALPAATYAKYQEQWLQDLKRKLMQQKTEDIMAEMDAEVSAFKGSETEAAPPAAAPVSTTPASRVQTPPPPASPVPGAEDAFQELDREMKK